MAFTGTPIIKQVADNLVRLSVNPDQESSFALIAGESATISLFENPAGDVILPEAFKPRPFDLPDGAPDVSLQDSIQAYFVYTETGTVVRPVKVVKTGTTKEDFLITFTNTAVLESGDTGDLEIYVRFH